jgi:hypothetical protein
VGVRIAITPDPRLTRCTAGSVSSLGLTTGTLSRRSLSSKWPTELVQLMRKASGTRRRCYQRSLGTRGMPSDPLTLGRRGGTWGLSPHRHFSHGIDKKLSAGRRSTTGSEQCTETRRAWYRRWMHLMRSFFPDWRGRCALPSSQALHWTNGVHNV